MTQDIKKPTADRAPISVSLLLIAHANPHGVRLPDGNGTDRVTHKVLAGIDGDIKTEIEFLPWMRRYRVTRFKREGAGKEETWPMFGKSFFIPETWAVHIEADA